MSAPDLPEARIQPSDEALIRESVATPERFAPLFDRHATAVHRYLANRVGGLADDLLGETFLIAFRSRGAYQPLRLDVRPWLFGIATNLLRRHARDEQRRYRALARLPTEERLEVLFGDDIAQRLDAQALRVDLATALAALKSADRDVLLLVAYGRLSYPEIAEVLNIPIGTVRSRLNRARRITRASLGPNWLDSDEETS